MIRLIQRALAKLGGSAAEQINRGELVRVPAAAAADADIGVAQKRGALQRILGSEKFRGRDRLRAILQFIVDEELAGRGDLVKGYVIGVDVLGRDANFDPSSDSIVRVEVGRLRRFLAHYYETEGAEDSILLTIPKGRYRPRFEWRASTSTPGFALLQRAAA